MIGQAPQRVIVEVGGQVAASLKSSLRSAQIQVSSFGRNVSRTMNDAALSSRRSIKGIFDNALWQQAAVGAAAVGAGLAVSVRQAASFEMVLSDIGKTANASEAQLKGLSAEVLRLSSRPITNLAPEKLAQGVQDLVAQGLELGDAVASMESLGKVATATNSDLLDVTKTGFQLQNALKIRPTELKATFDALAFAGKQGAFELRDMAQFMPTIAAAAGTLGIQGKEGAIALASMMQMVRKDAPDAGQAATRLTDAMLKMTAPDAVKNFRKFGVDIEQVLKRARAQGINPMEAALNELQRVTGGDVFKLSQIFGDKEAKLALMSLMKYRQEYAKLKADAGGATAAGTVERDFQKSLGTFQGTLTSFQNSGQRLGIAVGNALLPPLTRIAEVITPAVEGIAAWAAANPGLATGVVAIGGALAGLVVAIPIIGGIIAGVTAIGGAIAAATPIIAGIGTVLAIIGGPITLTIALVGALAVGAFLIVRNWRTIGPFFSNLWTNIVTGVRRVGPMMLALLMPVPTLIMGLFSRAKIGQRIITSILDGLKARAGALFSWIGGAVSRVGSMVGGGARPPAPVAAPPANSIRPLEIPGRALGGSVRAGMPYLVGERRPELFVPGMDGAVIPRVASPLSAAALAALLNLPTLDTAQARAIPLPSPPPQARVVDRPAVAPPPVPQPRVVAPPAVTLAPTINIHITGGDASMAPAIAREVRRQLDDLVAQAESSYRTALHD